MSMNNVIHTETVISGNAKRFGLEWYPLHRSYAYRGRFAQLKRLALTVGLTLVADKVSGIFNLETVAGESVGHIIINEQSKFGNIVIRYGFEVAADVVAAAVAA